MAGQGYLTLWTSQDIRDGRGSLVNLVAMAKRALARGETVIKGRVERFSLSSGYIVTGEELVRRAGGSK